MHAVGHQQAEDKPLNREPEVQDLVSSYLTTTTTAPYDRNHGPIPNPTTSDTTNNKDDYILRIYAPSSNDSETSGASSSNSATPKETPHSLTLADLKRHTSITITAALQCAGNRRHTMRTRLKEVQGIDWGDGAVMNCRWGGVRVCDVLRAVVPGIDGLLASEASEASGGSQASQASQGGRGGGQAIEGDREDGKKDLMEEGEKEKGQGEVKWHAQFECNQQEVQEDTWYGASIPLARAMDPEADVLLAYEMNDAPLPPSHGAPLRLIVPGICGARSVKWLDTIRISRHESANHYQQRDYKILPPDAVDADAAERYWGKVPPLMDMPVNSVVAKPGSQAEVVVVEEGMVCSGYAVPAGMDGPVVRVEVSVDGGGSWMDAELLDSKESKWAWMRWRMVLDKETLEAAGERNEGGKLKVTILSRASDKGGNTQEDCEWNLRGVAYNGFGEARDVALSFS